MGASHAVARPDRAGLRGGGVQRGAAGVLFSPAWKQAEAEHALAITEPAHAVGDHPVLAGLMPMLDLDQPITPGQGPSGPWDEPDPAADAVLVFSSGTTGLP